MIEEGVFPGDMLLVDKSINPIEGKIVTGAINGELTVKRLSFKKGSHAVVGRKSHFKPINILR